MDNRVKSLQTRSGHRLIFTEDESIILTDKSGNEIKLDTTGGNINITAPSSINITAGKSVNINAGEDISISARMNISTSATMNYTQMVGINYISTITGNASHFITSIFSTAEHWIVLEEIVHYKPEFVKIKVYTWGQNPNSKYYIFEYNVFKTNYYGYIKTK